MKNRLIGLSFYAPHLYGLHKSITVNQGSQPASGEIELEAIKKALDTAIHKLPSL